METPKFPMRINRYLAWKKHSTRKGGDDLVKNKKVFINGRLAVLGDKVNEKDTIEVKQKGKARKYSYYAYNKPVGIITHSPGRGDMDAERSIPLKNVFPVGRLDKDSHGLIILTDDGRITDKLLNPEYVHEKEYVVKTSSKLRPSFKKNMEAGVDIEGYKTKKCRVEIIGESAFKITLTEGKKHQIRRMCSAMHNEITDLNRIRIMNIRLGKLPSGEYRTIEGKELEIFMKSLGF